MKKILITGGAGFVGRHLCHALLEQGDQVICVDSIVPLTGGISPLQESGWPLYRPTDYDNFTFFKQDCREFFEQRGDTDFDAVFHLAAIVGGRELIENNPLAVAEDLSIDSMPSSVAPSTVTGPSVIAAACAMPIHSASPQPGSSPEARGKVQRVL